LNLIQRVKLYAASKLLNGSLGGPTYSLDMKRGIVTWQLQNSQSFVDDGFCANDIVYSVINVITNKAKIAPWSAYTIVDEKKYLKLKGLLSNPQSIKDWKEIEELKKQSLKEYKQDDRLNELLRYPNAEDTFSDLVEAWCGFKLITGNAYVYAELIEAGFNIGKPLSLNVLPSQYMAIKADVETIPATRLGYQLSMGNVTNFSIAEVLHDKMFNPKWNASGGQLYGMSPLQAAAKNVTRSNKSKDASVANLDNGGPAGILSVNDPRFDGDNAVAQANALKESVAGTSGVRNKNKIATSGYPVQWQAIGLSNVDLDIIKQEMWDMRSLCNIYGVPSQLMNDPENKIQANSASGEKALTVRAAIPLLISIRDNINRKLATDWGYKGKGIVVDFDLSVYPELQEDKANQAKWLEISMLPLRRRYEILGESIPEYLSEEVLNSIYVNGQALGDLNLSVDPLIDPYKTNN
jgi:HK97 family phage portal protein